MANNVKYIDFDKRGISKDLVQQKNEFLTLPNEMIYEIFKHLDDNISDLGMLLKVNARCSFLATYVLKNLKIYDFYRFSEGKSNNFYINAAKSCPGLIGCDFGGCEINDDDLIQLAKSWPKLQCIFLNCCYDITKKGLMDGLAKFCPDLKIIDLSFCSRISNDDKFLLLDSCPKLYKVID